jgi:hypothetical protein
MISSISCCIIEAIWAWIASYLVLEVDVTAAYTTITYRLGVIVTRLSVAAFWLGCMKQMILSA